MTLSQKVEMSNSVVNQGSVQAQFAALNNERDVLRQTTAQTNQARYKEESLLQNLHQRQTTLTNQIRVAHTNLGTENKKKQLLNEEIQRLRDVMEKDRNTILDISNELHDLEEEEQNRKRKFVRDMDVLNDELDKAVQSYKDKLILKGVSVETVKMFLETSIKSEVEKERLLFRNRSEEDEKGFEDASSPKWIVLQQKLGESLDLLEEATDKLDKELSSRKRVRSNIEQIRNKIIKGGLGERLGPTELDELERLWEEEPINDTCNIANKFSSNHSNPAQDQMSKLDDSTMEPIHMGLFYGNGEESNDPSTKAMITERIHATSKFGVEL